MIVTAADVIEHELKGLRMIREEANETAARLMAEGARSHGSGEFARLCAKAINLYLADEREKTKAIKRAERRAAIINILEGNDE